jgi:hypothetical protein
MQTLPHVVPVKGNIQLSVSNLFRFDLQVDLFHNPVGEKNPPGLDTHNHDIVVPELVFQQLMAQPLYGQVKLFFGKDGLQAR